MSAILYMKVYSSDLHYFTDVHYDFVAIYTFNYICRKEERPQKARFHNICVLTTLDQDQ